MDAGQRDADSAEDAETSLEKLKQQLKKQQIT